MRPSAILFSKRILDHKLRFRSSGRYGIGANSTRKDEYIFKPVTPVDDKSLVDWDLLDVKPEPPTSEPRKRNEKTSIPFEVTTENRFDIISSVMCPIAHLPYQDQLKDKYIMMKNLMQEVGRKLRPQVSPVVNDSHGLPCPVDFPIASPRIEEYRNKDEFSIWEGVDGNPKTVGFFVGEPSRHHNCVAVEPDNLIISKKSHRHLASLFQKYIREVSPLDVCFNYGEGGNWRRFVVRSNEEGEHMIIAHLHPQELENSELEQEMKRLKNFFSSPPATDINIVSTYFQASDGTRRSHEQCPYQLICGQERLKETVLGKQFFISPESFFQINTLGAEKLYQTILEEVEPQKNMTVIDIGSGTGAISLSIAPYVKRVIGIEDSLRSTEDAKQNAELNKIRNVSWVQGRAENELPKILDGYNSGEVVIIANPSRVGLRSSVMSTIRQLPNVNKLVYVSCKPGGDAMKNFVHLAIKETRAVPGSPLVPINARPVDMFPQTGHSELIVTFQRF